ncbi:GAF domain-like protein [Cryomyces antarcticus]
MVHADASAFPSGITKREAYAQLLDQARSLFEDQRNWVCNLANAASLLWHMYASLPAPSSAVNWAGFYVLDPSSTQHQQLILGPFHGRPACTTIPFTRGVCGAAASTRTTLLVPDVERFPGHVACDGATRSEVVVPILKGGRCVAVLDVDCAVAAGFDGVDVEGLEGLARVLGKGCDF